MLDFLKALFRPERSGATAKERLRLVLLSDHLSLAPDMVEALKADLFAVLSKYVEIDSDQAEVTFEQREREVAIMASVPILRVLDRPLAAAPAPVLRPVARTLPEPAFYDEGPPEVAPSEAAPASGDVAAAGQSAGPDDPPTLPIAPVSDPEVPGQPASNEEPGTAEKPPSELAAPKPMTNGVTGATRPRRRRRKNATGNAGKPQLPPGQLPQAYGSQA
jgi:cell division topological specificity factor